MNTGDQLTKSEIQKTLTNRTSNIFNIFQSMCFKIVSVGAGYLSGFFNISLFWLLLISLAFIYRDHQRLKKRFKQQVLMAISMRNERQMILDNVDHPPPWIYFPEKECCEWINKIVFNFWPTVTKCIAKLMKNTLEPKINEALSAYKKNANFEFLDFSFGSIPPRICSSKEYNKKSRQFENIILDLYLFYCGDTVIYFSLMSVASGGIENFEISGCIRVVFKMIVGPFPHLGGIEIFFLRQPKVDFNFTGALDILNLPGLRGMLHKTVHDQIRLQIVLPNKITMKMNDIVDSGHWKCPDPEGLVRIYVIEAKDLTVSDSFLSSFGTPSFNVVVTFGSQTVSSDFIENSQNPEWKFWANFIIDYCFDEYFLITVNDKNGNEGLGRVLIELNLVKEKKFMRSWVQLEDTSTGMIYLELYYYNLTHNPQHVLKNELPCLLVVFINQAFNLVNRQSKKTPNSAVYLEVGESIQVSKSISSNNPAFEEVFSFVINEDLKKSVLKLKLFDNNTKSALGDATLQLKPVFEGSSMEVIDQKYPLLNSTTESFLSLSMRLRIFRQ